MSISREFGAFISSLKYEDLPEKVRILAKYCFLDWLASAYAGSQEQPVRMMLEVVKGMPGKPECTLIPDGSKNICLLGALVNGASSHMVEMDDLHRASIFHPAAPIIPAALAVAEREQMTGRDLIVAIVVGYEVGIRVAKMVGKSHYHFWHTTATCGTFGAAAAASKLLLLNPQKIVWALGSAGTQASGLWEFLSESAMSKQLHPGKAALNGILAALLAQRGFTGAEHIFEGERGFCKATSNDYDFHEVTDGLGSEYQMEGNSFKLHASCGHIHSALDAVLILMEETGVVPGEIEKVRVTLYSAALELLGNVPLTSPYIAKFHIPFCIANALKFGKVGLEAFTQERLNDGDLRKLMARIELTSDDALDGEYPQKWGAIVEVSTKDGRILSKKVEYPKGDPQNPFSQEEVSEKFLRLTKGILPMEKASSLLSRILRLEEVERLDHLFQPGVS
ncbi:MAG: MmgE/PrpD family protein [Thermodesulfobacteriota bacterium]